MFDERASTSTFLHNIIIWLIGCLISLGAIWAKKSMLCDKTLKNWQLPGVQVLISGHYAVPVLHGGQKLRNICLLCLPTLHVSTWLDFVPFRLSDWNNETIVNYFSRSPVTNKYKGRSGERGRRAG